MALTSRGKRIIFFLIVLVVIGSVIGSIHVFLRWNEKLYETRGYGLVGHHDLPYGRARRILWQISKLYEKYGERFDWKWPDAKTMAASMPELVLVGNQPYEKFGIYIFKADRIKQAFLYSPNNLVANSKLTQMKSRFRLSTGGEGEVFHARGANLVVVCVMAMGEDPCGVYRAYNDSPVRLKEIFGSEECKKWYFIMGDDGLALTYYVQSDIPPIPGCLAYIDQMEPKLSKFYYPEEIVPVFKAIYPNAHIPEDQILREGRDY